MVDTCCSLEVRKHFLYFQCVVKMQSEWTCPSMPVNLVSLNIQLRLVLGLKEHINSVKSGFFSSRLYFSDLTVNQGRLVLWHSIPHSRAVHRHFEGQELR